MNDATTSPAGIDRVDWAHLSYLLRQTENNVVLPDIVPWLYNHALQHKTVDKRRKVRQCFTVTLTETALDGAEGLGEV